MNRASMLRNLSLFVLLCPWACSAGQQAHLAPATERVAALGLQAYRLISVNSGLALDVPYGSMDDGIQVQQWDFWNGPMQIWNMIDAGDGTYAIASANSGKVLDVLDMRTDPGAPVIQYDNWHGSNQRWYARPLSDGSYKLVNYNSGLCLDVYAISKQPGALLQQFTCWDSPNQAWQIQPVDNNGNPTATGLPPAAGAPVATAGTFVQAGDLQVVSGAAPAGACHDPGMGGDGACVMPAQGTTLAVTLPATTSVGLGLRVSTPNSDVAAHWLLDGVDVSGPLNLASTGSSDSFQTVYVRNIVTGAKGGTLTLVFDADGAIVRGVDVATSGDVPMIPRPGQIYFGGVSFMSDLQQFDAWPYVRANIDGFTFHSAAWGTDQMADAISLVQALPPTTHFTGELGALTTQPVPVPPDAGTGMGTLWGTWAVMMRDVGHVSMDHLNINFDPVGFIQSLAQSTPDQSSAQITQTALSQELDYEAAIHAAVPGMPLVMIYANPVFTTWKNQPAIVNNGLGGLNFSPLNDVNGNPIYVNGQTVNFNFDSFDFLEPYYQQAQNSLGYETDSPSNYLTFYGPESDPRNVTYRNKIYNYERWLHGLNKIHTQIINSDFQGGSAASPDQQPQWDQTYYNVCTQGIEIYQRNGGRADIYNAESWYSGPYTVVPETAPNTYTNLVMHLLKYLKGVGETLTMTTADGQHNATVSAGANQSQTVTLNLVNGGDVEAMPMVAATESGDAGVVVTYADGANNDITQAIARTTGYVMGNTVAAGANAQIQVTVTCPAQPTTRTVALDAYWNPQDPSQQARDSVTLTFNCGG